MAGRRLGAGNDRLHGVELNGRAAARRSQWSVARIPN
jgi:hypothetical protein